jgi:hypothetical protein
MANAYVAGRIRERFSWAMLPIAAPALYEAYTWKMAAKTTANCRATSADLG